MHHARHMTLSFLTSLVRPFLCHLRMLDWSGYLFLGIPISQVSLYLGHIGVLGLDHLLDFCVIHYVTIIITLVVICHLFGKSMFYVILVKLNFSLELQIIVFFSLILIFFFRQDDVLVREALPNLLPVHDPHHDGRHCRLSLCSAQTKAGEP
jgi:hypothetical protein